jgi:hypothetical protein
MSEADHRKLSYTTINADVLEPLKTPRLLYFGMVTILACGILWAGISWIYQVKTGMGVTGLSIPVAWAFYITNFVFWVGIGHAGTLISAILHLVRSRWRTAISRSAEAMTVFAVMTAALFPLVHLGRVWVFYYILPYPSQRQLWPDFVSPLVWDVCAVGTYLTVSTIFWLVGLIPDVAAARSCANNPLQQDGSWLDRQFAAVASFREGVSFLCRTGDAAGYLSSFGCVVGFCDGKFGRLAHNHLCSLFCGGCDSFGSGDGAYIVDTHEKTFTSRQAYHDGAFQCGGQDNGGYRTYCRLYIYN